MSRTSALNKLVSKAENSSLGKWIRKNKEVAKGGAALLGLGGIGAYGYLTKDERAKKKLKEKMKSGDDSIKKYMRENPKEAKKLWAAHIKSRLSGEYGKDEQEYAKRSTR